MPVPGQLIDLEAVWKSAGQRAASPEFGMGDSSDPATQTAGNPPHFGQWMLPHVVTFTGVVGSIAKVYRPSDEALKDNPDNAALMRNDLTIMECVEGRQRAVALLNWHIEPEDDKDQHQKDVASYAATCFERIPRFMQLRENLLHATWFGRYGTKLKWGWDRVKGRQVCALKAWRPVHGDKIVFRYDPDTREWDEDQIGIRVGNNYSTSTLIGDKWPVTRAHHVAPTDWGMAYFIRPHERNLIAVHRHYIEDGEYDIPQNAGRIHGVGLRSRIYWTWYQKQETLAWMMEYLERSAGGFEIWYYPWGNPVAKEETRKAAIDRTAMGRNVVMVPKMVGPDTFGQWYDRVEPSMAGVTAIQDLVMNYFGAAIKRYILGQTLTTESQGTGLGSNLADVHLATFLSIVKYDATLLEETITNDILDPWFRANFPLEKFRLRFRIDTETENAQEKLAAAQAAYQMGLALREQDIYDMLGFAKPDPTDAVLSQVRMQQIQMDMQAKQQQQQMAMQMAMQPQQPAPGDPNAMPADDGGGEDPGAGDDGYGAGAPSGPIPDESPMPYSRPSDDRYTVDDLAGGDSDANSDADLDAIDLDAIDLDAIDLDAIDPDEIQEFAELQLAYESAHPNARPALKRAMMALAGA
jgi:hypothetical protein